QNFVATKWGQPCDSCFKLLNPRRAPWIAIPQTMHGSILGANRAELNRNLGIEDLDTFGLQLHKEAISLVRCHRHDNFEWLVREMHEVRVMDPAVVTEALARRYERCSSD